MFHSTDVSPALGNITPKQTTEPDKTSHNSILKVYLLSFVIFAFCLTLIY